MGKKKGKPGLGRALMKGGPPKKKREREYSDRHTIDEPNTVNNLQMIVDENDLDAFMNYAAVSGRDFTASKTPVTLVEQDLPTAVVTNNKVKEIDLSRYWERLNITLKIPRRPKWSKNMSAEELHAKEREAFTDWRRSLAQLEESDEEFFLTPFEKNLEVWRQLWRVVERSHIIVQIVDSRNPLLFRSKDLEEYVKETNPKKKNVLLINKADFLTERQRWKWARYFQYHNVHCVFWSANRAQEIEDEEQRILEEMKNQEEEEQLKEVLEEKSNDKHSKSNSLSNNNTKQENNNLSTEIVDDDPDEENSEINNQIEDDEEWETDEEENEGDFEEEYIDEKYEQSDEDEDEDDDDDSISDGTHIYDRDELVTYLKSLITQDMLNHKEDKAVIGMVGYPNVGKSSTINVILGKKRVAVAATPGKTKHFQTHHLDEDTILCDCPGLVFPSPALTKEAQICDGILPVDYIRQHRPPVALVCQRIPRDILEATYGINIEGQGKYCTASELLEAVCRSKSWMSKHGRPDEYRAARFILKDYVKGKLLYCYPPPPLLDNESGEYKEEEEEEGVNDNDDNDNEVVYEEDLDENDTEYLTDSDDDAETFNEANVNAIELLNKQESKISKRKKKKHHINIREDENLQRESNEQSEDDIYEYEETEQERLEREERERLMEMARPKKKKHARQLKNKKTKKIDLLLQEHPRKYYSPVPLKQLEKADKDKLAELANTN